MSNIRKYMDLVEKGVNKEPILEAIEQGEKDIEEGNYSTQEEVMEEAKNSFGTIPKEYYTVKNKLMKAIDTATDDFFKVFEKNQDEKSFNKVMNIMRQFGKVFEKLY